MRADLGWSYFEAGTLNTANAVGYIIGALAASAIGRRFGWRATLVGSLIAIVASVFLCAASSSIIVLSALRVVAGIAGGTVYVVGGGLAAQLGGSSPRRASRTVSIYFGGVGGGILLSALVVPAMIAGDPTRWRLGWIVLGAGCLIGLAVAVSALGHLSPRAGEVVRAQVAVRRGALRHLLPTFVAYFLQGVGYIAYMTFVVALIRSQGASTLTTSLFWGVLGLAAMLSAPLLAPAFADHRSRGGRAVAIGISICAVATILPVLSGNRGVILVSAALFGGSFIAVSSIVAFLTRELLEPEHVTAALGKLTVAFAVGQVLGPVAAGSISDTHAGLRLGLSGSAVVLALAVPIALLQRGRDGRSSAPRA